MDVSDAKYNRAGFILTELTGALSAAVITIPQAIGYGLIAFAAIGAGFTGDALLLGLYSAVAAGLVAALFGGTTIQITGPKAPLTLLIATVVAGLAASPHLPSDPAARTSLILWLTALCVLTAGVFQVLIGSIRLGGIIKFVPHSVISGFMNGVALLLILGQIRPFLGLPANEALINAATNTDLIQPISVITGMLTLAAILASKRITPKVPGSLAGLLAGTVTYYSLETITGMAAGQTLGAIEFHMPRLLDIAQLPELTQGVDLARVLPAVLVSGLILGVVASIESLLSSVAADNLTHTRHDSNRELIGQGLGNVACSLLGALPAAGSIPRSVANFRAGGRTRLSGVFCALLVLIVIAFLSPAIGKIPLAVIAAIIIGVGIDLFDNWTADLVRKLKTHAVQRREVLFELFVTAVVAVITLTVNLVVAVIVGMVIVSALTIWQLSKSIVRREYSAAHFHSRKVRSEEEYGLLAANGDQIRIFELQGPLFFGSADRLANQIESSMRDAACCILDMKHVTNIDSTGARILLRTEHTLDKLDKRLLICHLPEDNSVWRFLELMNVINTFSKHRFFKDTDAALEWAEDQLLSGSGGNSNHKSTQDVKNTGIFNGLTTTELQFIHNQLQEQHYKAGEIVFCEGEENNDAFIVLRGSITIIKEAARNGGSAKRLITFGPGSLFGELGFVDQRARSATARADVDSVLLRFSYTAFRQLRAEDPGLALKIMINISHEISNKLRHTSEALTVLENA